MPQVSERVEAIEGKIDLLVRMIEDDVVGNRKTHRLN